MPSGGLFNAKQPVLEAGNERTLIYGAGQFLSIFYHSWFRARSTESLMNT